MTIVLAVGIVATGILLRGGQPRDTGPPPASPALPVSQAAVVPVPAGADFRALNGRWLRPDGGYILEIQDVEADGKIHAVYLNPRPIHVAKAEATREGATLKVFVELRAAGYPGSTYTLTYDEKRDQLAGVYFQAALGQSFEVIFVRMK